MLNQAVIVLHQRKSYRASLKIVGNPPNLRYRFNRGANVCPMHFCFRGLNMNIMTTLKVAALAIALPIASQAATIVEGFNYNFTTLSTGGTYTVDYDTEGKTWDIGTISFTANGSYADIALVTITFSNSGDTYNVWTPGQGSTATLAADGFVTSEDFAITYTYALGGSGTVLANATFNATEVPAPVPVPAAGFLFVSALAGLGIAKRRRNKA